MVGRWRIGCLVDAARDFAALVVLPEDLLAAALVLLVLRAVALAEGAAVF